jgi:hypothetical protein
MVSRLIAEMISAGRLAQNDKHYVVVDERLAEDPGSVPRANRSVGTRILKKGEWPHSPSSNSTIDN